MPLSTLDAVVSLAKRRGFVYPSGEIYGQTRSAWDYGPLGVALKENVRRQWWRSMVQVRDDVVGLDTGILLPPQTWSVSGHVAALADPLTTCVRCGKQLRADHVRQGHARRRGADAAAVALEDVPCPACGARDAWAEPEAAHMLLHTSTGLAGEERVRQHLRPETAQGAFLAFANVLQSTRKRPPFGIAQTGRSFRNEITPGNLLFRMREFEQMELEFFVPPGEEAAWHSYWVGERMRWYTDLGLRAENLRTVPQPSERLSHYARSAVDIEYRFRFPDEEWGEVEAVADRGDGDLRRHAEASGHALDVLDPGTGKRYVPSVVEPATGLSRAVMAFLVDAYDEDEAPNTKGGTDRRAVLRLDPRLAPVKVAVLPLSRNAELSPMARDLAARLRRTWMVDVDDSTAIGRRYRRQDEVGTPYCVTVDFETPGDQAVTVRERDSMRQERVGLDSLETYLAARLAGC